MFWIGLIIGYVLGNVIAFLIECLCIAAGKSDTNKWFDE